MGNKERRPTLKDVAALSGVSVISASRVMRNAPNIVDGIDDALKGSRLRLVLGMTKYEDATEEAILRDMLTWNPAAVILSGLEHSEAARICCCNFRAPSSRSWI